MNHTKEGMLRTDELLEIFSRVPASIMNQFGYEFTLFLMRKEEESLARKIAKLIPVGDERSKARLLIPSCLRCTIS